MPIVHIHMWKGKTVEQKRAMVKEVTNAICKTLDVPADMVIIQIVELPKENVAVAGKLSSD
jgi:4-oxalocrotonate tautomerase